VRRLLTVAVALVAAGTAVGATRTHTSTPSFFEPKVISDRNGVFRATMVGREGTVTVNGKPVQNMKTYNGMYPGPTLKMQPGDKVEMTVVNHLDQPTNFHFHGFRVTPANIGDNVLRYMAPAVTTKELKAGLTYKISFTIPKDHQHGLYWYHPHMHGYVGDQVYSGMTGLIEVGSPLDEVPDPAIRNVQQHVLALQAIQVTPGGKLNKNFAVRGETNLVNGRYQPTITMHPGETQLWRVANISPENWYKLQLTGHTFHVVAEDGNPVPYLRDEKILLIPPGKRFEFLVQGGQAGTYQLRSLAYNQGFDNFGQFKLVTLHVSGAAQTPLALPHVISPEQAREQSDTLAETLVAQRTLTFSIDNPFPKNNYGFRINGKIFDPRRVDESVVINTTEEWLLKNTSNENHPFHIHTNDFLVEQVNGKPVPIDGFQDVASVPRHGSILIRMRYRTFPGDAVFHCHILFHEDHGMMGIVQFRPPTKS
jgi:suppressor of ftsI